MKHSHWLLVVAGLGIPLLIPPVAAQAGPVIVFSGPGPYMLPETISQAPSSFGTFGGSFIVPDAVNLNVWAVPSNGGAPTNIATNQANSTFVSVRGGVFLPSNWGGNAGSFLEVGYNPVNTLAAPILLVAPNGSVSQFSSTTLNGGQPQIVPSGFGSYGGDVVVPNYNFDTNLNRFISTITLVAPDGSTTSLASGTSLPDGAGGAAFAPSGFGALGGKLFVDGLASDQIDTLDANGDVTPFATVPLKTGQPSPFQMAFAPSDFFPGLGSLLFVSIRGSTTGKGTLGDVLAYNSSGILVASLRTDLGLTTFDPRGLLFIPDPSNSKQTDLLISDASSGQILLFAPQAFTAVPEPSSLVLCMAGLLSLTSGAWFGRKRIV
jgi:hypothetical protein